MSRRVVWMQILIGWLPIWALFTTLIVTAHAGTSFSMAALISLRMIVAAAALGLLVQRLTERVPWPNPVRPGFVLLHFVAALVYAIAWVLLNSLIESVLRGALMIVIGVGLSSFIVLGVWMYVMIAGVSYTMQSSARAARAEATATQAQLDALRAQLNPHFLFNALHTVVQLIPREPKVAAHAAEEVAGLLRTTLEEDRDIVSLERELDFVRRYLDVESIRFGDRLRVSYDIPESSLAATLPSFALQTLVENAVRHGAAPRVEPTDVVIDARLRDHSLHVSVRDTGAGIDADASGSGTGLRRLRERLAVLYRNRAEMTVAASAHGGTIASLRIPQEPND
jgi:signal transduction histidine kinase